MMSLIDSIMPYLIAFLGGMCFSVVYKIPRKYFLHASLLSMLAKIVVELLARNSHIAFATFVASVVIAVISHIFARTTGKPAQAFLIPGVMYLVPGASMYKGFSAALENDFTTMNTTIVNSLTITAAISFALLLANWVVPSKRAL
jgi:uncharacterized membrane protein YjjB (DUF3815 family)